MNAINTELFKSAEIPTDLYPTRENPYSGLVASLVGDNWDEENERSIEAKTAVLPYKTEEEQKAVAEVIRLAQLAGKTHDVTVRKTLKPDGKGKVALTLWAVKRITRTAKEETENVEE